MFSKNDKSIKDKVELMENQTSDNKSHKRSFVKGTLAVAGAAMITKPLTALSSNKKAADEKPTAANLRLSINESSVARGRR